MRFYAFRKPAESNEKLVMRFKKLFFGSKILQKLRKERYNVKARSQRQLRMRAIVSQCYRDLNDAAN